MVRAPEGILFLGAKQGQELTPLHPPTHPHTVWDWKARPFVALDP